jgi:hypothetical protein
MRDRKSRLLVEFRLVAFFRLVSVVLVKSSGCFFKFIAFSCAIGLLYPQQSAMFRNFQSSSKRYFISTLNVVEQLAHMTISSFLTDLPLICLANCSDRWMWACATTIVNLMQVVKNKAVSKTNEHFWQEQPGLTWLNCIEVSEIYILKAYLTSNVHTNDLIISAYLIIKAFTTQPEDFRSEKPWWIPDTVVTPTGYGITERFLKLILFSKIFEVNMRKCFPGREPAIKICS